MEELLVFLELLGTAAFAVSGAMTALRKSLDPLGVVVLGLITAVGGGVLRDLLLGITPPKIFDDPLSVSIAVAVSVAAYLPPVCRWLMRSTILFEKLLLAADSVGLGLFVVVGTQLAFQNLPEGKWFAVAFLGTVTGVGGSILRDVLVRDVPYIFRKHIYALAAPIISAYCVLSVVWSRIFLKEKLSWKHYLMIALVVAGIVILGIYDE